MLIIISAMTRERVIGNHAGNGMPWNVPDEYKQFLSYIRDQAVIMGRKSFEVFKGDLSTTANFIVSRSSESRPNATICQSLDEAIEKALETGKLVFICGGGEIYRQAIPHAQKMYLSFIKGDYEGGTYFPEFEASDWNVTTREDHAEFEFAIYERKV